MPIIKRVTTREFLRNINDMTEPVEVYTRNDLKGTWYPADTSTWANLEPTFIPVSEPIGGLRADSGASKELGTFGAARPAPKPSASKKRKPA